MSLLKINTCDHLSLNVILEDIYFNLFFTLLIDSLNFSETEKLITVVTYFKHGLPDLVVKTFQLLESVLWSIHCTVIHDYYFKFKSPHISYCV